MPSTLPHSCSPPYPSPHHSLPPGDEYGQSRQGNNNYYGHDTRLTHYDWGALEDAKADGWFRCGAGQGCRLERPAQGGATPWCRGRHCKAVAKPAHLPALLPLTPYIAHLTPRPNTNPDTNTPPLPGSTLSSSSSGTRTRCWAVLSSSQRRCAA